MGYLFIHYYVYFIGVHEPHASLSLVYFFCVPLLLVESKKVLCYCPFIFRLTYSFKPIFICIKRIDNILNKQMALFGCEGILLGEKAFKCLNTTVLKRKLVRKGNPVKHKM